MKKIIFALLFFTICFSLFSQTEKPDALKMYNSGKFEEAINICRQEIEDNPDNLDSYVVLCWSLISNKQYSEADYWAEKGRQILKYDARLIEIQAEAKFYLDLLEESLLLFQEYISLVTPSTATRYGLAYYFMGEIYTRLGKYNHADIAFTTAVKVEPQRSLWWTKLGYARECAEYYTTALDAYNQALTLNPSLTDAKTGKERVTKQLQ